MLSFQHLPLPHGKETYLIILTSSNQLYSGTGTALFEWIRHAKHVFDFAICIDNLVARNYMIARDFCRAEGLRFLPCGPARRLGAPDPGVADAQRHAASGKWAVIEIVSWANAATNFDVVEACAPESMLVFTPHTQPAWTVPGIEENALLEPVFNRALTRADVVFCVSPLEVDVVKNRVPGAFALYAPNGIDVETFCLSSHPRKRQILMVADFAEPRKRVDLGLAAMTRFIGLNSDWGVVIGGRGSDAVAIPESLKGCITRAGFVSRDELVALYQQSAMFVLLSDYEAFCIPLAESLACGTPIVTNATQELLSLYSGQRGCYLARNDDQAAVDAAMAAAARDDAHLEISQAAQAKFASNVVYQIKLDCILGMLERNRGRKIA